MLDTALVLNSLLVLISSLHMLYQRRPAQNLIAWMLTLILLPYLGVLLYLIFGSRKILYRQSKPFLLLPHHPHAHVTHSLGAEISTLIEGNGLPGPCTENTLTPYHSATEAYQALETALREAKKTIYLETYIFKLDETGKRLLDLLSQKVEEGVKVYLLIDAFGALPLYLYPKKLKPYQERGIYITFFHPLSAFFKNRINLRTHRKIYLIDSHIVFTGGMNLSQDYLTPPELNFTQSWVDLLFKMEGTIAQHYEAVFKQDWYYNCKVPLPATHPITELPSSTLPLQAVPSGPDTENDVLLEALLQGIYRAQSKILIITPYLIPSYDILTALQVALKKGIEVTLITPSKTDHLIFDWGRSSYMRELVELGADIHCYQRTMLHAKLVIFDDSVMMLGSANLDYRSLLVNYEMVSFCYSEEAIKPMQIWAEALITACEPYKPNLSKITRLLENLSRIITPIL